MKYLNVYLVLFICCLASVSVAQDRKFDVVLTLNGTTSRIERSDAAATAKIINRSPEFLETATLPKLNVYFSACQPSVPSCLDSGLFFATIEMPKARIAENRALEVGIPLSDLYWTLGPYRPLSGEYFQTDLPGIPKTNIFLYADVKIPDGFVSSGNGEKKPKYRESVSNVLVVSFE